MTQRPFTPRPFIGSPLFFAYIATLLLFPVATLIAMQISECTGTPSCEDEWRRQQQQKHATGAP